MNGGEYFTNFRLLFNHVLLWYTLEHFYGNLYRYSKMFLCSELVSELSRKRGTTLKVFKLHPKNVQRNIFHFFFYQKFVKILLQFTKMFCILLYPIHSLRRGSL